MRFGRRKPKSTTMARASLTMAVLIILLLAALVGMKLYVVSYAQNLAFRYIEDTAGLFVDQLNNDMTNVNNELLYLLNKDKDLRAIPRQMEPNQATHYELIGKLKERIQGLRIRYPSSYQFFIYSKQADFLILDNGVYFKSSQKSPLAEELTAYLTDYGMSKLKRSEWHSIQAQEDYLFSVYEKNDIMIGTIIKAEALFDNLNVNKLGYEELPFIKRKEGGFITSSAYKKWMEDNGAEPEDIDAKLTEEGNEWFSFSLGRMGDLGILVTPTNGVLERIMRVQLVSITLIVIIGAALSIGMLYYYRRILIPMKQFVKKLHNQEEEQWIHNTDDNHILELEMASKEFKQLMREVKQLKIAVYEKELLQKKTELEYMQEQIRPHFYLGCLSIIHGIAEQINADEIVRISESLSGYMRYVMQGAFHQCRLSDEIEHVKNYVEIQKLRYGNRFSFQLIQEEGLERAEVPPLLLQTFVENAINHGLNLKQKLEISVYLAVEQYQEEQFLYITISDTGTGFPKEILQAIEQGEEIYYDNRRHIGIQNVMRRLKILYGNSAKITLSNMEEGLGAIVELTIPHKMQG